MKCSTVTPKIWSYINITDSNPVPSVEQIFSVCMFVFHSLNTNYGTTSLSNLATEPVSARDNVLIECVTRNLGAVYCPKRQKCYEAGELLTRSPLQSFWHRWPTQSSKAWRSNSSLGPSGDTTSAVRVCGALTHF